MTLFADRLGEIKFVHLITIVDTDVERGRLRELCVDLAPFDEHRSVHVAREDDVWL